jgi:FSR family fosmidomycin resistance protein-like MFS transporter
MHLPRKPVFWAVSVGHFINDTFMGMYSVLLAFISATLIPMTNAQIGFIVSMAGIAGAITQPLFGMFADRRGGRWLGSLGIVWTVGVLMLALGAARTGQYWLMVVLFILPAVGSGAFHPVGSMHAAETDHTRVAYNLSIFFLLGQTGFALGPMLAGLLLNGASPYHVPPWLLSLPPKLATGGALASIWLMGLAVIPGAIWMVLALPSTRAYLARHQPAASGETTRQRAAVPYKPLILLIALISLRGLAQPGAMPFVTVLFEQKGWTPAEYGLITGAFTITSGFTGVLCGILADRYDRRYVVVISMLLSAPAFFLLPAADKTLAFALAILAGGLSGGSHGILVVMGQEILPGNRALASGMILGLIFGAGALGSLVIGALADSITLPTTFQIIGVCVAVASLFGWWLPAQPHKVDSALPTAAEIEIASA